MTGQRASSSALRSPSSARAPPLGLALIWGIRIWFHLKNKAYIRFLKGFHWCSDQTSSNSWKLLDSVLLYHSALLMGEQIGLHQLLLKYSSRANNTTISWGGVGWGTLLIIPGDSWTPPSLFIEIKFLRANIPKCACSSSFLANHTAWAKIQEPIGWSGGLPAGPRDRDSKKKTLVREKGIVTKGERLRNWDLVIFWSLGGRLPLWLSHLMIKLS